MSDEEKKGNSICPCVRWHAPKPTKTFNVGGHELCPVTAHAVGDLLDLQRAAGKWVKKNEAGFNKFQKDLARELFASEGGITVSDEEEASTDVETEASADELAEATA